MRAPIVSAIQKAFRRFGFELQRNSALWSNSPEFRQSLKAIRKHTLVSDDRCFMLYQYAQYASSLLGSMAELGVYQGGTAKLIAKASPAKTLHLFDTFSGLPDALFLLNFQLTS